MGEQTKKKKSRCLQSLKEGGSITDRMEDEMHGLGKGAQARHTPWVGCSKKVRGEGEGLPVAPGGVGKEDYRIVHRKGRVGGTSHFSLTGGRRRGQREKRSKAHLPKHGKMSRPIHSFKRKEKRERNQNRYKENGGIEKGRQQNKV